MSANTIMNEITIKAIKIVIVRTVTTTHINMTEDPIKTGQDLQAISDGSTKPKEAEAASGIIHETDLTDFAHQAYPVTKIDAYTEAIDAHVAVHRNAI